MKSHSLLLFLVVCCGSFEYAQSTSSSLRLLQTNTPTTSCCPSEPPRRTVSSSGEGIIRVSPDKATITFGVVTTASTANAALTKNSRLSAQALESLRSIPGINEENITLLGLSLQPHQVYVKNSTFEGYVEDGYDVTRTIQVETENVSLVPTIVATVVGNGSNRLMSVQYGLQDTTRERAQQESLTLATHNSVQRASAIVNGLPAGTTKLGPVLTVNEGNVFIPSFARADVNMLAKSMMPGGVVVEGNPEAFSPGMVEVRASVSAVFELLIIISQ